MEALWQDVKYGMRMLAKAPGFALVAVLTLAVGIGANTAIFSLANELLLRPRPGIANPGSLADVGRTQDGSGFDNVSYANYIDYRDRNTVFSGLAAYTVEPYALGLGGPQGAERIYGQLVSGNYFQVLGVRPAAGRFFTSEEDRTPLGRPVAVLSHGLWQRRFAGDPAVVGRVIKLNGHDFTIVGVAAPQFRGTMLLAPDVWMPLMMHAYVMPSEELLSRRENVWLLMLGRLKPDVSLRQAQAGMGTLASALEQEYPRENRGQGITVQHASAFPGEIGTAVGAFVALLMAVVAAVLLIASFNVAGMLLARVAGRQRELAVRMAVGAERSRVFRQLLTETVLLFALAGVAGILVSLWMTEVLGYFLPQIPLPLTVDLAPDHRVFLFAMALPLAAGLVAGLAPALHAGKVDLAARLKEEAGRPPRGSRLRGVLVAGQVALSLVLLVGAGLFLRAWQAAAGLDPGFDPRRVEVASLDFFLAGYDQDSGGQAAENLLQRARALPGVESAAFSRMVPLQGGGMAMGGIIAPGVEPPPGRETFRADWNIVTPDYFRTLRIPLVRGRDFSADDRAGRPDVVIINETVARTFWPHENPLGKRISNGHGADARTMEVVGVARDGKYRWLGESPRMFIYVPFRQWYHESMELMVRTQTDAGVAPAIRALVHDFDANLPVIHVQSLEAYAALGLLPQRVASFLAGSFGLVGLLLAGLGVYGISAQWVGQRTREIGIRMALGARAGDVVRLVLRQGTMLAAAGAVVGILTAAAAGPLLSGLLYGVSPADPLTFLVVAMALAAVSLLACWIPARRAARISPVVALRYE